jgi:hypothetical protein
MDHYTVLHFAPRMMRAGQPTAQTSEGLLSKDILYPKVAKEGYFLSLFGAGNLGI